MDHQIKNVAIIMDGNGRWANQKGYRRIWGHVRGSQMVSPIIRKADDLGLESLTLYAFSKENFQRSKLEVKTLFKLLKKYLKKERQNLIENNVHFKVIGEIEELPRDTQELVRDIERETRFNTGLKLKFAFGYSSRDEIADCVNSLIEQGVSITSENISSWMNLNSVGDVDLLIRTSGDQRVSNFLLWQISYAEFFFAKEYWPEFTPFIFEKIINNVSLRERRFGKAVDKYPEEEQHEFYKQV